MKSSKEIIARIEEVRDADVFGTQLGDLVGCLPFSDAKQFLVAGVEDGGWHPMSTDEAVRDAVKDYLPFAFDKTISHRGLSAIRSIDHLRAWLWLIGEDGKIDWDNYQNYGAPILQQVAELFGVPVPDDEGFRNMAKGQWCGRYQGCGCNQ